MSSSNPKFIISNITLDSVTWTPVIPVADCNGLGIKTAVDIKIRTDSADSTTQDTIPAGAQEVVMQSHFRDSSGFARFPRSQVACYLQAVSATPSVTLRFIR